MTEPLHVLVVDDDPGLGEAVAHRLSQGTDELVASTEQRATDALDRIRTESVACVVSDYELPAMDGLELLDAVREFDATLPFILFTGSGSESLASEGLSRGLTDYVQTSDAKEPSRVLVNRIENAIEAAQARQTLEAERERYRAFLEQSTDLLAVVDASGEFEYVSQSWQRIMGYEPAQLVGENAFELMHPADVPDVWIEFNEAVNNPAETRTAEFRFEHADGSLRWLEAIGNNELSNPVIEGFIVNVRDITERKEHEQQLREQNDRLERFASIVSHDLRNPMNIISGRLELARDTGEDEHFEAARAALTRMDSMIDEVLELAREGCTVDETEPVELAPLLDGCREAVDSECLSLDVTTELAVEGDRTRLRRVFENLLRNAVEHGSEDPETAASSDTATEQNGTDVTVSIGTLEDASGFYVEDDGPGIPVEEHDAVLETGYTTDSEGTGLGLAIVNDIIEAHDWTLSVTHGTDGGAQFEVTDIEAADTPRELC